MNIEHLKTRKWFVDCTDEQDKVGRSLDIGDIVVIKWWGEVDIYTVYDIDDVSYSAINICVGNTHHDASWISVDSIYVEETLYANGKDMSFLEVK